MTYHSPLGFKTAHERRAIRARACNAALRGVRNRAHMTYSEGWNRWSGINQKRLAANGQYPPVADCSAFVTWCYWDATRPEETSDFVNGLGWGGGYTGTMVRHGEEVDLAHLLTGDAIFYGGSFSVPQHVALHIGDGHVVSMGLEGDPRVYPINLNGALSVTQARRFIR